MQNLDSYQELAKKIIGVPMKDVGLLLRAFTHRSYLNEHKKTVSEHNERLEFLGDAVLELVVTEYLYATYSEPEGILTNWRSSLVRTESIGAAAARLGFENYLLLSRGEKRGSERARAQILANCFEAVIGAIFLDQGYKKAGEFIKENILNTFEGILESGAWVDAKSRLQEETQSRVGLTPVYKVLSEVGPDHDKVFDVGVFVEDKKLGSGQGPSKQAAQQKAAEAALKSFAS